MVDSEWEPSSKRGTAVLVLTIIVLSSFITLLAIGPSRIFGPKVRVAVIDSGINPEGELAGRIIAEKSFISEGYGYSLFDNSTRDSSPHGTPHGTYVARTIIDSSPSSIIVNAKVVTSTNEATESAIAEAIRWSVEDEDCSVINLSLGGAATLDDPVAEAVRWAFAHGVVIIAAAGNGGAGGVAGSSVESPAMLLEAIAVAAVNEAGDPYDFSARGPLRNGTAKPDISAYGFYADNNGVVYGTSFAAPRVSAAAAEIISFCLAKKWQWSPGMIKALLLSSASHLSHEYYEVGSGLLDLEKAKLRLENVPRENNLPLVAWMTPKTGPWDFERWFINSTSLVTFSIFASDARMWRGILSGSASHWAGIPEYVNVNQTASFTVRIHVISNESLTGLRLLVELETVPYGHVYSRIDFDVDTPIARVAIDISHTNWAIDSIYGQFREFYVLTTDLGVAVEEIRDPADITSSYLGQFDALFILDACSRTPLIQNGTYVSQLYRRFSRSEINAIMDFWDSGGNIFIAGLSNRSIHLEAINVLLTQFNMSFQYDHIPSISIVVNGIPSTELVTDILPHVITQGVDNFDYYGCSINIFGSARPIAQTRVSLINGLGNQVYYNRTLVAVTENSAGGRMVVSGSNFFIDNWGILGHYKSAHDAKLARQIVMWLVGILN
ncbi:MAG: S8 family peptidase [Candidatus Thorarchaeota archaeon]